MSHLNASLNAQLAHGKQAAHNNPSDLSQFKTLIFSGPDCNGFQLTITSYDAANNLGVAETYRTKARFAFSIGAEAKPVANRGCRNENHVNVFDIDTVATPDGIAAEVGAKRTDLGRTKVAI